MNQSPEFRPLVQAGGGWPHRLAWLTSASTLLLIYAGGLVTSLGAGLAVPDWPTTFGYNMFLYPWSKMVGGIFYEHSHRLLGSLAGLLTLLTAGALWMREPRKWVRWLGVAALGLVVLQGLLGGLRVVLVQLDLAMVHACAAQLFFGLMVAITLITSSGWRRVDSHLGAEEGQALRRLAAATAVLIYLQTGFGAILRHTGQRLDAHLLLAVLVAAMVLWTARKVMRNDNAGEELRRPANALWMLLALQGVLGVLSYLVKFTAMGGSISRGLYAAVTSSHVLVGSLLFGAAVVLVLRLFQAGDPAWDSPRTGVLTPQAPA